MTAIELKDKIIGLTKLKIEDVHPLQSLMLDECCDKVLESDVSDDNLLASAILTFNTCNDLMIGIIDSNLKLGDVANINYRGGHFTFKTNTLKKG